MKLSNAETLILKESVGEYASSKLSDERKQLETSEGLSFEAFLVPRVPAPR